MCAGKLTGGILNSTGQTGESRLSFLRCLQFKVVRPLSPTLLEVSPWIFLVFELEIFVRVWLR